MISAAEFNAMKTAITISGMRPIVNHNANGTAEIKTPVRRIVNECAALLRKLGYYDLTIEQENEIFRLTVAPQ